MFWFGVFIGLVAIILMIVSNGDVGDVSVWAFFISAATILILIIGLLAPIPVVGEDVAVLSIVRNEDKIHVMHFRINRKGDPQTINSRLAKFVNAEDDRIGVHVVRNKVYGKTVNTDYELYIKKDKSQ